MIMLDRRLCRLSRPLVRLVLLRLMNGRRFRRSRRRFRLWCIVTRLGLMRNPLFVRRTLTIGVCCRDLMLSRVDRLGRFMMSLRVLVFRLMLDRKFGRRRLMVSRCPWLRSLVIIPRLRIIILYLNRWWMTRRDRSWVLVMLCVRRCR